MAVHIDPSVKLPNNYSIGTDTRIYENTVLADDMVIGHDCIIGKLVNFEKHVTIGNHVTVYSQSHLTTGLEIGNYAWIGPMFLGLNTRRIRHVRDFPLKIEPPIIKQGARLGARATLMPGVVIGEEALIAACAVVTKDVPPFEIWRGFPARKVGMVPEEERLEWSKLLMKCDLCREPRSKKETMNYRKATKGEKGCNVYCHNFYSIGYEDPGGEYGCYCKLLPGEKVDIDFTCDLHKTY